MPVKIGIGEPMLQGFVMANNTYLVNAETDDVLYVVRAKNRLFRLYERLGTWRAVQHELQVRNVATVYNFAVHGIAPRDPGERVKIFLPRQPRKPKEAPADVPEWLKRRKKAIRRMVAETGRAMR